MRSNKQKKLARQRARARKHLIFVIPNCCSYCRTPFSGSDPLGGCNLTRDHIIPRSAGGLLSRWNFLPACEPCNRQRKNMPFPQWVASLPITIGHANNLMRMYDAAVKYHAKVSWESWHRSATKLALTRYGMSAPTERYREKYELGCPVDAACQSLWETFERQGYSW